MTTISVDTLKTTSIVSNIDLGIPYFYAYDGRNLGNVTTNSIVPLNTILYDTHSGFNTSTFKYTIPVSGMWKLSWGCFSNIGLTAGYRSSIVVGKLNGTTSVLGLTGDTGAEIPITSISNILKGETVWVQAYTSGFNMGWWSSFATNWFYGFLIR